MGASSKQKVTIHLFPSALGKVYFAAVIFKLGSLEGLFRELSFFCSLLVRIQPKQIAVFPGRFPADNFFIANPQVRIASCVQNPAHSQSPAWALRAGENYLILTLQSSPKPAHMRYARSMSKRQHEGFALLTASSVSFSYWGWQ